MAIIKKLNFFPLGALVTLTLGLLAACGGGASATSTSQQLYQAYTTALGLGDLAAFSEILTADFEFTQVPGPGDTDQLTVTGKSAYMVRLAAQIENKTELRSSDVVYKGLKGSGKFSLSAENYQDMGIDALTGTFETTAKDGKLARFDIVLDPASVERLEAASGPPESRELFVTVSEGKDTLSINAFLPARITIRAWDMVTWNLDSDEPHTVTFSGGGGMIPFAVPVPGGGPNAVMSDPQGGFPTKRPGAMVEIYSGTGHFNSGFMSNRSPGEGKPPNNTFSLIFERPGTYDYRCLIHRDHRGSVNVLPRDAEDVPSQELIDARAREQRAIMLAQAERLKQDLAEPPTELGPNGTTIWHIRAGGAAFDPKVEIYEFFPSEATIEVGDTVVWSTIAPTIHTVTFHPGLPEPLIVFSEPSDIGGPAMLVPNDEAMFPNKPAGEFEGTGLWGSGLISIAGAAGGNAFTMTFTKAGTYDYKCLVHSDLGMEGTITVVPRQ